MCHRDRSGLETFEEADCRPEFLLLLQCGRSLLPDLVQYSRDTEELLVERASILQQPMLLLAEEGLPLI